jgi:PAS domain S-box-containing protein
MLSVPAVPFRQPARVAFGRVRALLAWVLCAGALAAAAPAWSSTPVPIEPRSFGVAPRQDGQTIAHDVVDALSRATGLSLKLQLMPLPQARVQVQSGAADVIGFVPIVAVPPPLQATTAIGESALRPYAWEPRISPLNQPLRSGQRVAVIGGLYPDTWLQTTHPAVTRVPARDFADAVQLLRTGQADAFLGFELGARMAAQELFATDRSVRESLIEGPLVGTMPFGLMVHPRNPQLLRQINEGIRVLRASGELDALRSKWEPAPVVTLREYRQRQWITFGAGVGAVMLLVSSAVALWLWRRSSATERDRKQLADHLQGMQAMERELIDNSPLPIALARLPSAKFVRVNDAYLQLLGFTREQVIGQRSLDLGIWVDRAQREALVDQAIRTRQSAGAVVALRHRSGSVRLCRVDFNAFTGEGGDFLISTVVDFTDRETQRREYEAIFHQAPLGMMVMVNEGVVQANAECERLMGWPAGTALGRNALEFWRDEVERDWARSTYAQRLRTEGSIEFAQEIGGYSGRRFFAHGVAVRISDPADKHLRTLWIWADATEEARVAAEREAARRAAEDANDAKSRFLANVSHEIRTPLHALVNLHEMIGLTRLNDAQRELLHKASHAGHGLMALVSDVLDFSKIEAGALVLEHTPFALDALVQGVDSVLQAHPRAAGVHLSVQRACKGPVALVGDPTRLRQVLINLGTNALKFTPHGEVVVRIGCQPLADDAQRLRLVVSVRDTGIGMDAVTQAALFAPFLQADASITRRYGGTGLGLAISQSITRAMGGEITVQSSPGAGSEFMLSIELPMAPMESAALITGAAHGGAAGATVDAAGEASGTGTVLQARPACRACACWWWTTTSSTASSSSG